MMQYITLRLIKIFLIGLKNKLLFKNFNQVNRKLNFRFTWLKYFYICIMIDRKLLIELKKGLKNFPSLAILGARQTGKTTLAKSFAKSQKKLSIYLDLENPSDLDKLEDAYTFLNENKTQLIMIDEVQRKPELFAILRSLIDKDRMPGRFFHG